MAGWLAQGVNNDLIPVPYGNSGNDVAVVSLYLRRPPTAYQAPQDPQYGPLLDAANAALSVEEQKAKSPEFAKAWASYSAFREEYKIWREHGYLK